MYFFVASKSKSKPFISSRTFSRHFQMVTILILGLPKTDTKKNISTQNTYLTFLKWLSPKNLTFTHRSLNFKPSRLSVSLRDTYILFIIVAVYGASIIWQYSGVAWRAGVPSRWLAHRTGAEYWRQWGLVAVLPEGQTGNYLRLTPSA